MTTVLEQSLRASRYFGSPVVFQAGPPTKAQLESSMSPELVNIRIHCLKTRKSFGFRIQPREGGTGVIDWSPGFLKQTNTLSSKSMKPASLGKVIALATSLRKEDKLAPRFIKEERDTLGWMRLCETIRSAYQPEPDTRDEACAAFLEADYNDYNSSRKEVCA